MLMFDANTLKQKHTKPHKPIPKHVPYSARLLQGTTSCGSLVVSLAHIIHHQHVAAAADCIFNLIPTNLIKKKQKIPIFRAIKEIRL